MEKILKFFCSPIQHISSLISGSDRKIIPESSNSFSPDVTQTEGENLLPDFNAMRHVRAHPANAPGDFYVEDGCCTSCNMPFTVAPDLFSSHEDGHCYVSKQPHDAGEVYRMIQAFEVQDVGCIRYGGKNRVIKLRLVGTGEGDQCDHLDQDLEALNSELKADRWGLK